MLVAESGDLPIGLKLASANQHEVKLTIPALQTVRVPRGGAGRPKQRPKELVADKVCDSKRFRRWLRSKSIKPTIPPYERRVRKSPKLGRPVKVGLGYKERWKVRGPSLGLETSGGCWCAMSSTSPPSEPSSSLPSSSCS
jgi:hypothetical protein